MSGERDELEAAVRARVGDDREATAVARAVEAEGKLSPADRRGIAATIRALVKPLLRLLGVRLP